MQHKALDIVHDKIFTIEQIQTQLKRWRLLSNKIVFTNGCFDILHLGHVDYLAKSSDEGDILIVGVNSDKSTSGLKGPNRPINNQEQRSALVAALQFVSAVIIFDEPTPYDLIKIIQPDVLIKGADYKPEQIAGYDVVKARNGVVKTVELLPGYSTTKIEEKIRGMAKQ